MNEQYKRELAYKYTKKYRYEKYKRTLTSLKRKTRETHRGPGRMWLRTICGDPRYRYATLIIRSQLHDLDVRIQGSQMILPRRV